MSTSTVSFPFPNDNCARQFTVTPEPLSTVKLVFLALPLSLIAIEIIFGNALVILAFIVRSSLRTPPNAFLVSLAIIDMSVGVFVLPLNILLQVQQDKWPLGRFLCKVWLTTDVTLCSLSIFHLIAIALDRYRAITDGVTYMQRRSFRSVIGTVLCLWVFALWISSPPILGWNDWDESQVEKCHLTETRGYRFHSTFGCFIFPMFLMLLAYWKIYSAIQIRLRERARLPSAERTLDPEFSDTEGDNLHASSIHDRGRTLTRGESVSRKFATGTSQMREFMDKKIKFSLTRERRAAKTLGMIVGAFVFCWIPFSVIYILDGFLPCHLKPAESVFQAFTWLGYINSGLNPIIYTIFNKQFRDAFKKILIIG